MNNQKQKTRKEKTQRLSVRVPYSIYDLYERRCIEEHITMSKLLRETIVGYLERTNFNSLSER
jgi:hypothetical protein